MFEEIIIEKENDELKYRCNAFKAGPSCLEVFVSYRVIKKRNVFP